MIAEDDGEIDTDLPELQREDRIGRFGFKYLGIVEVSGGLVYLMQTLMNMVMFLAIWTS